VHMSATANDLCRMGAVELARAIQSRQASSREVVEAHLLRIEQVNGALNAITVLTADAALAAADLADRSLSGRQELPPLHGVPFTVKGNIDVYGLPTTQGSQHLLHAYPSRDAPIVERMRAAGAILSSTEMMIYELLRSSGAPAFRELLPYLKG